MRGRGECGEVESGRHKPRFVDVTTGDRQYGYTLGPLGVVVCPTTFNHPDRPTRGRPGPVWRVPNGSWQQRRGAGSTPAWCTIFHTVLAATGDPGWPARPGFSDGPSSGFSRARRSTRVRITGSIGGRPGRACGYVQCRSSSRRRQRNSVVGVTKKIDQRPRGSSRGNAASTARSAGCSCGRCICRRATATSCRSPSSSMSLAPLRGYRRGHMCRYLGVLQVGHYLRSVNAASRSLSAASRRR
jgi:hypothetical protein